MRKIVLILAILSLSITGVVVLREKTDRAIIVNYTPFKQKVSDGYGDIEGVKVGSWFYLNPGESKVIYGKYRLRQKSFFIHSQTVDTARVRYVYGDTDILFFEGLENTTFFNPDSPGVQKPNDTLVYSDYDLYGYERLENKSEEFPHLIYDGIFSDFLTFPEEENERSKMDYVSKAIHLSNSLQLQLDFDKRFPEPSKSFPFHLGVSLMENSSNIVPGVVVEEKLSERFPDNGLVPLEVGDIIVGFNDNIVFSNLDLFSYLYLHGYSLDKGIEKGFGLTVLRNNEPLILESSYFFNPFYFGEPDSNKMEAIYEGIKDTIFYGKSPEVTTFIETSYNAIKDWIATGDFEFDTEYFRVNRWKRAQKRYRLKQFNQKQFTFGNIASMFFSPAQVFTKSVGKGIAKTGISLGASKNIASIAIEIGEESLWLYNTEPVVSSGQTFTEKLKQDIPIVLSVGVITGSINRLKI